MKHARVQTALLVFGMCWGHEVHSSVFRESAKRTVPLTPALGSDINAEAAVATIEAGTEESIGRIRFAYGPDLNLFSIEISSPIGKDDEEAEFANLSGLAGTLDVAFAWSGTFWNPPGSLKDLKKRTIEICDNYAKQEKLPFDASGRKDRNKCRSSFFKDDAAGIAARSEFEGVSFGDSLLFHPTVKVEGGRETFEFLDESDFSDQKDTLYGRAATAALGILTKGNHLWTAGYRDERRYTTRDEATICTPISGSASLTCDSGPLGRPGRTNEKVAYVEYRKLFRHLGLSPRASRGFKENVTGIDVPFYFLKDSKGGFTGGIRVGWRSDTHEVSASVMVGAQLRLWE